MAQWQTGKSKSRGSGEAEDKMAMKNLKNGNCMEIFKDTFELHQLSTHRTTIVIMRTYHHTVPLHPGPTVTVQHSNYALISIPDNRQHNTTSLVREYR